MTLNEYIKNRLKELDKLNLNTISYNELQQIKGRVAELNQLYTYFLAYNANILAREAEAFVTAQNLINRSTGESQDNSGSPIS